MKRIALQHFHQPPLRLNCAQAVLAAYQETTGDTSMSLPSFQAYGGGRAPQGLCGAVHAAALTRPALAEAIKAEFLARTGALGCRELKARGVSCKACVELAAEILQQRC